MATPSSNLWTTFVQTKSRVAVQWIDNGDACVKGGFGSSTKHAIRLSPVKPQCVYVIALAAVVLQMTCIAL
jgi:hypothetical protein